MFVMMVLCWMNLARCTSVSTTHTFVDVASKHVGLATQHRALKIYLSGLVLQYFHYGITEMSYPSDGSGNQQAGVSPPSLRVADLSEQSFVDDTATPNTDVRASEGAGSVEQLQRTLAEFRARAAGHDLQVAELTRQNNALLEEGRRSRRSGALENAQLRAAQTSSTSTAGETAILGPGILSTPASQDPTYSRAYPDFRDTFDQRQQHWEQGGLTGMPGLATTLEPDQRRPSSDGLSPVVNEAQPEGNRPPLWSAGQAAALVTDEVEPRTVPAPRDLPQVPSATTDREELINMLRVEYREQFQESLELELRIVIYREFTAEFAIKLENEVQVRNEAFKRAFYALNPSLSPTANEAEAIELMGPAQGACARGRAFQAEKEKRKATDSGELYFLSGTLEPRRESMMVAQATKAANEASIANNSSAGTTVFTAVKMKHQMLGQSDLNLDSIKQLVVRAILFGAQPGHKPQQILTYFTESALTDLIRDFNTKSRWAQFRHEQPLQGYIGRDMTVEMAHFLAPAQAEQFLRVALTPKDSRDAEKLFKTTIHKTAQRHGLTPDSQGRLLLEDMERFFYMVLDAIEIAQAYFDWFAQTHKEGNKDVANQSAIACKSSAKTNRQGLFAIMFSLPGFGTIPSTSERVSKEASSHQQLPKTVREIFEFDLEATALGESKAQADSQCFQIGRIKGKVEAILQSWRLVLPTVLAFRDASTSTSVVRTQRSPSTERSSSQEVVRFQEPSGSRTNPARESATSRDSRSGRSNYTPRLQYTTVHYDETDRNQPSVEYREALARQENFFNPQQDSELDVEEDNYAPGYYPDSHRDYDNGDGRLSSASGHFDADWRPDANGYHAPDHEWRSTSQSHDERYDSRRQLRAIAPVPSRNTSVGDSRSRLGDRGPPHSRPPDGRERYSDPRDSQRSTRGGDSRYPLPANGQLVDPRARSPKMPMIACRKHMAGLCTSTAEQCTYSHAPDVCELEFSKIKSNMERPKVLQQSVIPYTEKRDADHAAWNQRLAHARSKPTTPQHAAQHASTQSKGVSWGSDDLTARVAQLDVHYNRELAMLQQQAAGQSVLNLADGESDGESGYSSAGDF